MRLLLAATSFPRNAADWRGRFIFDQATALVRQGVDLRLWAPPGELPAGAESALSGDDAGWLTALLDRGGIAHLLRRRPWAGAWAAWQLLRRLHGACLREARRSAHTDCYLINWMQNALALPDDGRAAIITVLGSDLRLLRLPGMRTMLRVVFKRRPTIIAPNAGWMQPRLEAIFGDVARVQPVPFGVDRRWFEIDRSMAESGTWLAVTRITRDKIGNLFDWGEGFFGDERRLHLFGPMQEQLPLPPWVNWHGPTYPEELRDNWFPRATGLITLSRHDEGRPQVMLEAMAAGLPVIASDLPAHRDLILQGETGWLITEQEELGPSLARVEEPLTNRRLGAAARCRVKESVGDWDDCAARYLALLDELRAA